MLNYKNKPRCVGFTLLELLISIAIGVLLVSVAVPAYQKYIAKSKLGEGYLALRKVYDAQVVAASLPFSIEVYIPTLFGAPPVENVTCKKIPTFQPLLSVFVHPDYNPSDQFIGLYPAPLPGKKGAMAYFTYEFGLEAYTYDAAANTCTAFNNAIQFAGDKRVIERITGGGQTTVISFRYNMTMASETGAASYFGINAGTSSFLASEYGVAQNDTLMITAHADFDGDHNTNQQSLGVLESSKVVVSNNALYPFGYDKLTTLARGLYLNTEGEPTGTAIIEANVGE
ncbi:MAG TPA: prepilin-type N-terminal cleavage/methylation domain-containing protein [Oligoflexia bacterium]|mgnify:CR=1 FL=1|nr:prepilin-type N-terminal cleavage/methylation domain-containing protein [Oligoflexia bacterium]HMR25624.1 prepilin-type N-terminal cleavage/methylation domain-containing protein [Oligoflexia bacterium]